MEIKNKIDSIKTNQSQSGDVEGESPTKVSAINETSKPPSEKNKVSEVILSQDLLRKEFKISGQIG